MAQLEDGWPLGLQPLNARVGLVRNLDRNGSISFSTFLTGSPTSSTGSSSDLDTQSTGSFFRDRSITLGSLIGVSSSILGLSRRSVRRGRPGEILREKKSCKLRPWLFSLCSKLSTDAVVSMNTNNNNNNNNAPSLGHFLQAERRAATVYRRNPSPPLAYGPDDFSHALPVSTSNSLFVDGSVAPPPPPHQSSTCLDSNGERRSNRGMFEQQQLGGNGYGSVPLSFSSCLCRQLSE